MTPRSQRLRVHLRIVDGDVAPVVARYRDHIQCRPGCGECCRQSFAVSEVEGELLREGLAAAEPATRAAIVALARAYAPGTACPALGSDERCLLYAHRPRICRKYGIPLWHPERPHELKTCRLNFRGVADLDADLIVEPQAGWAADWIALREELGLGRQDNRSIAAWLAEAPNLSEETS
ncbi:YkgJ family cysteine cluster protein [Nannocystis bainbridge]|uniref:YkgJ family cysteine cluster protein n=1 Tax=Nannocystis bainbridge TaxID=2995303 RepID=A0ABT5DZT8_9BACT|nr:YkgJ family cysteine cluster protein [Nannocystis bainbridge]MDC0718685.1 YkgJ family cysteine cluster protein [Nannocystis bainbridge]